ncbi:MAG: gamma-glutamyltransferase [Chloroflexi bacterium]|nr:gamma-glutamyltransferase [Chloroflexota bacterium]
MVQSPHGVDFESHRPVVMGRNGMVCAGHPLAAQAGMSVLQKGGNAVDAAIATAAAVSVVEPNMSGIGGDGFIMVYNKAQNKIDICNATGAAPYATDLAWYQANGIPQKGIMSFSVPALVDGWMAAHERYGSLKLSELFAAAIDLADNGFPVSHVLSRVIANDPLLQEFPTSQAIFAPGGKPLQPGQIIHQKNLAKTFPEYFGS